MRWDRYDRTLLLVSLPEIPGGTSLTAHFFSSHSCAYFRTPQNFQHTEIRTILAWFRFVARKGAQSLCEIDCKKQFDNIKPGNVTTAFNDAAHWLYRKRRWRQTEVVWSISQDSAKLDRAGEAASHRFLHLLHDLLSKMLLHFEMHENNFLLAGGSL